MATFLGSGSTGVSSGVASTSAAGRFEGAASALGDGFFFGSCFALAFAFGFGFAAGVPDAACSCNCYRNTRSRLTQIEKEVKESVSTAKSIDLVLRFTRGLAELGNRCHHGHHSQKHRIAKTGSEG